MDNSKLTTQPPAEAPALSQGVQSPGFNFWDKTAFNASPKTTVSQAGNLNFSAPIKTNPQTNFKENTISFNPPSTSSEAKTTPVQSGALSFPLTATEEGAEASAAKSAPPPATSALPPPVAAPPPVTAPAQPPLLPPPPQIPALPLTPTMTFSQLEDQINKWTAELGEHERLFLNQATQINAWDHLLATNCIKLSNLNNSVERVKSEQKKINYDLDFILAQQKELHACLEPLEKEYLSSIYTNDVQRENIYNMAENIDLKLKRMSEDLKETIEHINETSRSQESVDPVLQIGKILNAHMNSLQWIDENTTKIQTQLEQLDKTYENYKRMDRFDKYY